MMPGNPQILICPFCGKEKQVMSLVSGNTFGAELWSDNKQIAPMLPEISYVQKCPDCGKYYIKARQEVRFAKEGHSFEQGILSFLEMKEAYSQLMGDGLSEKEEINVRMMLHHAYNDYYYRSEEKPEIEQEDKRLFHDNGLWLIENLLKDGVLKAEFYREIGEFDIANGILDSLDIEDGFLKQVASIIREKLDASDCAVFKIR
jgi:predicted RNA-binding Zn-ribbon protein involved in translation (DUF1610 family)